MRAPTAMPRVSIILPVYNGQEYLDEALASLVNQTFTDFELLIINDGSTDQSVAIIESWIAKDHRLRLLQNGGPHGLPHALNLGLREARGQYIARADQDDVHRPERLAIEVTFLNEHPQIALVGSAYQPFTHNGRRSPVIHPVSSPAIAWQMLIASAFCHPSVLFRREVYLKLGGYPITGAEDFAYFSRVVRHWPTANIPEVLIDYREHSNNYSITRREAIAQSVISTFRENLEYYLGSLVQLSFFYDFIVRRYLPLGRLPTVARQCSTITAKIEQTYGSAVGHRDMMLLRLHVARELFVVSLRTLLCQVPLGNELLP